MTDSKPYATLTPGPNESMTATLYKPIYSGASVYLPNERRDGITPGNMLEQTAEWLRGHGFDVTSWRPRNDGFLVSLRAI